MKRLIANHTSPEMNILVDELVSVDSLTPNWTKLQADPNWNLATNIVNNLPTAMNNQLILKVYKDIVNGLYNDIPKEDYLQYTINLLKSQGILFDYQPQKSELIYKYTKGDE